MGMGMGTSSDSEFFPWFRSIDSFSDNFEIESSSFSQRRSYADHSESSSFDIGSVCDLFNVHFTINTTIPENPRLCEIKTHHPTISHFDLMAIPISEDPNCSFDICVYYLQNQNTDIDHDHNPNGLLSSSNDSDLFQAFETSLTISETVCPLDCIVNDPRQSHPGMSWSMEMLQCEGPLGELIRLTHVETLFCFPQRSSTLLATPSLHEDELFSFSSESGHSASSSLLQSLHRPFYSLSKSPLSTETFFDMPPTPDITHVSSDIRIHAPGHDCFKNDPTPRTPSKIVQKLVQMVFPPKQWSQSLDDEEWVGI